MSFFIRFLGWGLKSVRCGESKLTCNLESFKSAPQTLQLSSRDFLHGGKLPQRSGGVGLGDNISPPLQWKDAPQGTKELVLILEVPLLDAS